MLSDAMLQEMGMANLQQQAAAEHAAAQRAAWLEEEVERLESELAAERAQSSDNRGNLEAQVLP